jgi:hypothetical protein
MAIALTATYGPTPHTNNGGVCHDPSVAGTGP